MNGRDMTVRQLMTILAAINDKDSPLEIRLNETLTLPVASPTVTARYVEGQRRYVVNVLSPGDQP